jgi:transposase-like protein
VTVLYAALGDSMSIDLAPLRSPVVGLRHAWLVKRAARSCPWSPPRSAFAGFRFPAEVIVVAVRWYLRFGLSYRDVEELLADRGIEVDHVTVYRWVQRFTPLLADAARFARHSPGDRWFVDETYVKVNSVWRYVYRAVDQYGQVIDVLLSARRDAAAARRFFSRALRTLKVTPSEVITDAAPVYPGVLDELLPAAWHHVEQYENNPVEADHGKPQAPAASHAGPADRSYGTSRDRRTRLRPEPAPRPLRHRTRHSAGHETNRRVHRPRPSNLTGCGRGSSRPPNR